MKRLIALLICLLLTISIFPASAFAAQNADDIIILYENDVHCTVEGYSKLAAMKAELQQDYKHVGVISGGDYLQGNSLGVVSQGAYIVDLMNLVGYDAVTLGNHEFDYNLTRLEELIGYMYTKPISCNFGKVGETSSYFAPYSMVSYGDVDIAYIGITTPATITSHSAQFKDEKGNFIFTFHETDLYEVVQANIDAAKAEGADYVIAVSHIGYAEDEIYGDLADIETLIANTEGFDVVLDAHSHSVLEGEIRTDKGGNEVLLSSTGTKFANIGKLTISEDGLTTQLIATEDYAATDPVVDDYIAQMYAEYAILGEYKVGYSECDLVCQDAEGNRLVRLVETNLGDLCADALRYCCNSDIAYVNGGGIRADILQGDVTYNSLLNVFPFNNTVVLAEVSGQTILDMMEMAMMKWPEESGSFPHLSGITFSVDARIPSSVVIDEYEEFVSVDGEYRVHDIQIFDPETGNYEPMDLNKTYTISAFGYFLNEYGSGMKMLENATILQDDGMLDVEALDLYISEVLNGVIGADYQQATPNITFIEGDVAETTDETAVEATVETAPNLLPVVIALGGVLLLVCIFLMKKKTKA